MNLRTQIKNTRMQKGETIQEYFSRISQFKEQLEANSVRVLDKKKVVSKIRCYNCPKLGHFSYNYPQGKGKRKHQAHVAEEEESPPSKKAFLEIEKHEYLSFVFVWGGSTDFTICYFSSDQLSST